MDEERMRPGHWLGISDLCFLQCFNAVGSVPGRTSGPWKNLCHLSPKVLFWDKWREEN